MKIQIRIILLTLLIGTVMPLNAYSQTIRELTLSEAIEIAQKNSKSWAQFDAKEQSAQAQYKEVEAHWWPILSIDSTLLLWSDASQIEVMDKEEVKQNVQNAVANLDLSESMAALDPTMQMLLQGTLPAIQSELALQPSPTPHPIPQAAPQSASVSSPSMMPFEQDGPSFSPSPPSTGSHFPVSHSPCVLPDSSGTVSFVSPQPSAVMLTAAHHKNTYLLSFILYIAQQVTDFKAKTELRFKFDA